MSTTVSIRNQNFYYLLTNIKFLDTINFIFFLDCVTFATSETVKSVSKFGFPIAFNQYSEIEIYLSQGQLNSEKKKEVKFNYILNLEASITNNKDNSTLQTENLTINWISESIYFGEVVKRITFVINRLTLKFPMKPHKLIPIIFIDIPWNVISFEEGK